MHSSKLTLAFFPTNAPQITIGGMKHAHSNVSCCWLVARSKTFFFIQFTINMVWSMDLSFIFHAGFFFLRLVRPSKKAHCLRRNILLICLVMYYILTTRNVVVIEAIPCIFVLVIKTIMICSVCGNCLDDGFPFIWLSFQREFIFRLFFSSPVLLYSEYLFVHCHTYTHHITLTIKKKNGIDVGWRTNKKVKKILLRFWTH